MADLFLTASSDPTTIFSSSSAWHAASAPRRTAAPPERGAIPVAVRGGLGKDDGADNRWRRKPERSDGLVDCVTKGNQLMRRLICVLCVSGFSLTTGQAGGSAQTSQVTEGTFEYRLPATTRTSTLEREMNEAAEEGYRFQGVMGGETAFGGSEVVSIMMRSSLRTAEQK